MSEGEKKKIVIDANLFSMSSFGGKSRKRGPKKEKPQKEIKIKTDTKTSKAYKTQIMKKIREQQNNKYKDLFASEKSIGANLSNKDEEEFKTGFKESVDFLKHVADTQPVLQPPRNHTFKNNSLLYHGNESLSIMGEPNIGQTVNLDLPKDFFNPVQQPMQNGGFVQPINVGTNMPQPLQSLQKPIQNGGFSQPINVGTNIPHQQQPIKMTFAPQPKFGCLKGGNLPTYKAHTMKLKPQLQQPQQTQQPQQQTPIIGAISLPIMRKLHEQKKEAEKPKPKIVQKKIKKIMRRTFHVGKNKLNRGVGVLLPNRTIRNNVTAKSYQIKTTPISEIRKFLINRGFIKVGSTAPTDVLRKMYESLVLIGGEVKNHNPDNLLYNFFTTSSTKKSE